MVQGTSLRITIADAGVSQLRLVALDVERNTDEQFSPTAARNLRHVGPVAYVANGSMLGANDLSVKDPPVQGQLKM